MKFELIPIFERMESIYQLPYAERFEKYLYLLQEGNKDKLKLPISGFNPMGKPAVLEKLHHLMALGAEAIADEELVKINQSLDDPAETIIKVVLNLADDHGGAWTNHYTTDFSMKFQIKPLVTRNFCTPYFWTSEQADEQLVRTRVRAAALRTLNWLAQGAPTTLADHLASEVAIQSKMPSLPRQTEDFATIKQFYDKHQTSEAYHLIFNFFYGDKASELMGFKAYGNRTNEGFKYAKFLAES